MAEETPKVEPKTETKKKAPEIAWDPRMQFIEGSSWWEILEINGDSFHCICSARGESKQFKRSEADRLAEEYQKQQKS